MSFRTSSLLFTASRPTIRVTTATRPAIQTLVPRCQYAEWRGTRTEDHGVTRAQKGDKTDPETANIAGGQKEKARSESGENEADEPMSQATSERPQSKSKETAEKEFPKAPRPIIGMTDERGRVSCVLA